ncbi:hypothetical protein B0H12DRAFT_1133958 [Mycena haematopus]|nr:hypothetical protein B0H12DRAFT_1133958 [Mycena haematopus]
MKKCMSWHCTIRDSNPRIVQLTIDHKDKLDACYLYTNGTMTRCCVVVSVHPWPQYCSTCLEAKKDAAAGYMRSRAHRYPLVHGNFKFRNEKQSTAATCAIRDSNPGVAPDENSFIGSEAGRVFPLHQWHNTGIFEAEKNSKTPKKNMQYPVSYTIRDSNPETVPHVKVVFHKLWTCVASTPMVRWCICGGIIRSSRCRCRVGW